MWVMEGARTSSQDFTTHVGIGSRMQEALDNLLIWQISSTDKGEKLTIVLQLKQQYQNKED